MSTQKLSQCFLSHVLAKDVSHSINVSHESCGEMLLCSQPTGNIMATLTHHNSSRIEGISDDVIPGLEIPTGTPLVYELDKVGVKLTCVLHLSSLVTR